MKNVDDNFELNDVMKRLEKSIARMIMSMWKRRDELL